MSKKMSHIIIWDFEIQTDNHQVEFVVLVDHRVKMKESEKRDKYLDLAREQNKAMRHESDSDIMEEIEIR